MYAHTCARTYVCILYYAINVRDIHKQILVTPNVIILLRGGGGYPHDANGCYWLLFLLVKLERYNNNVCI